MKKFKLCVFVHDFIWEIGHSKAVIELIARIPNEELEEVCSSMVMARVADFVDTLTGRLLG